MDRGLTTIDSIEADRRVNLEVGKVEVNIYGGRGSRREYPASQMGHA